MVDIFIATVLSVIISGVAVFLQQPASEIAGIINVVFVFALTFGIYFAIKRAMLASRVDTTPEKTVIK